MRNNYGNILFFSDFDSGNLDKVEEVVKIFPENVYSSPKTSTEAEWSMKSRLSDRPIRDKHHSLSSSYRNLVELNTEGQSDSDTQVSGCLNFDVCSHQRPSSSKSEGQKTHLHSETNNKKLSHMKEFKVWTRLDCARTPYENVYRTWFYFGVQSSQTNIMLRIHVMNLNKQSKLMCQGMSPVFKVVPGKNIWQRIPYKPTHLELDGEMILTFDHHLNNEPNSITYFAFTYPFTYTECQAMLSEIEKEHQNCLYLHHDRPPPSSGIYYARQLLCTSPNNYRVDLLTITSVKGMSAEREERLPHLFPDSLQPMCHKFTKKKIVFVSARVHPGETQSSFVINGFIKFLLDKTNIQSQALRENFIFKFVPMLNPDGVYNGHYRTDYRGKNLNRVYLNCDPMLHPAIFSTRSLLIYYHYLYANTKLSSNVVEIVTLFNNSLPFDEFVPEPRSVEGSEAYHLPNELHPPDGPWNDPNYKLLPTESGVSFYLDLHGHASKRGCFIFGNNFNNMNDKVESMLLAKLMSLNFSHFDFGACNFTTQNMVHRGARDGLSKEGSGRVALYILTKLIHRFKVILVYLASSK